jgi:hypothetical protein
VPPSSPHEAAISKAVKVWGLLGLGILLLLLVTLLAVIAGSGAEDPKPGAGKASATPRPDAAAPSLTAEAQLAQVEQLIVADKWADAEKVLLTLVQARPRDPQVHLLMGHVHCHNEQRRACLGSYQSAILLKPEIRENERLLANLGTWLTRKKGKQWGRDDREATVTFIAGTFSREGKLGPKSAEALTEWVNKWWEADLIWKVIAVLDRHKVDSKVDYVHAYKERFRQVASCEERKTFLTEIELRKDPKFLPLLVRIYKEKSFKIPFKKSRLSNACLQAEARRAIESLGGTVPEMPAMTVRSERRKPMRRRRRGR